MTIEPEPTGDAEVRRFLEAVFRRYGYDWRAYAPASIRRRVQGVLAKAGLTHVSDLEHRVLADPRYAAEVFEDMTVRVSEMFRDPSFFRAFRERLVPLLRTYPRLHIWISGCATGEEAYSTAILLTEEGLYDRCQIYATDLSSKALEHAKEGIYSVASLRRFADNYARTGGTASYSSYITKAYDRVAIQEALRRNICFFQHDLIGDQVFAEMHLILCRNVFIYFGRDLQNRVAAKFTQCLHPGGVLGLGASERLPSLVRHQFAELVPGEKLFRFQPESAPSEGRPE